MSSTVCSNVWPQNASSDVIGAPNSGAIPSVYLPS